MLLRSPLGNQHHRALLLRSPLGNQHHRAFPRARQHPFQHRPAILQRQPELLSDEETARGGGRRAAGRRAAWAPRTRSAARNDHRPHTSFCPTCKSVDRPLLASSSSNFWAAQGTRWACPRAWAGTSSSAPPAAVRQAAGPATCGCPSSPSAQPVQSCQSQRLRARFENETRKVGRHFLSFM